jgi:hypothetical protein
LRLAALVLVIIDSLLRDGPRTATAMRLATNPREEAA